MKKTMVAKHQYNFVYKVRITKSKDIFEKTLTVKKPIGKYHLFKTVVVVETEKSTRVPEPMSLCGKGRSDIGDETVLSKDRPENIPVCEKCEELFKTNKESPWYTLVNNKGLVI